MTQLMENSTKNWNSQDRHLYDKHKLRKL